MERCCLCGSPFSPSFRGASFIQNTNYRLCLKCASSVKLLTKFNAPNQAAYEDAFYWLHKKLLVNKYPDEVSKELFEILKDITTYSEYLKKKEE